MQNDKILAPNAETAKKSKKPEASREEGGGMVEYVLLVALIAIACIFALRAFSGSISAKFSRIGSQL